MVLPDSLIIIQDGGAFVKGFCLTEGGVFCKWIAKDPALHCRCQCPPKKGFFPHRGRKLSGVSLTDGRGICRECDQQLLGELSRSAAAREWVGAVRPHTRTYSFEKE